MKSIPSVTKTEYNQCLEEMYALHRFGIKLELATMATILAGLNNPQEKFPSIHIAGTNGKGSIAALLSAILHRAGHRVGRYTSPHLIDFNERITINNRPISNADVVNAYRAVKNKHGKKRQPTFFEYTTAMAFYAFAHAEIDIALIETGMGGKFDATNILNPCLSVVSNISLEHQGYLGNTLAAIAGEKAGIIKPKIPVITGVRQKSAILTIESVARKQKAPFYRLGDHFKIRASAQNEAFSYYGVKHRWRDLAIGLAGDHQHQNAALAVAACDLLIDNGWNIPETSIRQGLVDAKWPARLEIVSQDPFVLIDGAHNLAAAKALAKYIADRLANKRITLIIGILDDKAYRAILKTLAPLCHSVIVTQAQTGRAIAPAVLGKEVRALGADTRVTASVPEAIRLALEKNTKKNAVCIAGSLYVAGEAKEVLQKMGLARP